ncbi:carboxypeptidase-like regulatory domain-containing protein [Flavobacterium sp.]|uniref:carboxypeptidase-like regulatory domain-containing protein n=1 Tax=Flavobacterium sp. TaxID=239 RepID=UPI00263626C7|nr:carboxypeptidase-like regulatory domain-containing protein [Flavobacterium sp.]
MKKLVFSTLFVLQAFLVFAQQPTGLSGKVVDSKTQKPLQNVVASIQNSNLTQITDAEGKFVFTGVAVGGQLLQIKSVGFKDQLLPIEILANQMLDLGVLVLEEDQTAEQQLSLITITENDLGDDNSGSESTSGLLQASRDAFQQSAAFNWGQARFRMRGLDNEYGVTMMNGITMNKIYDGRPQYSNWGGLNDATRNQEFTNGSAPSDYTFGGILGTNEINTRASVYRKGNRISFGGTNTNYTGRLMGTIASGMQSDGWAYVISASRRFATEGYFEGTTYDANSFFASIEKRLSQKNSLNITAVYGQNNRGKNSPNTQEITDLAGEKYNSYWGWQNGEKRNSRVKRVEEPLFILSDYWKITSKTNLNINLSYQLGEVGNSRLEYQGVNNPDPTYYRSMPSYFTSLYENDPAIVMATDPSQYQPGGLGGIPTPDYAGAADAKFLTQKQIDWESMYRANTLSGTSKYALYEDRTDDKQWSANTVLSSQLADNIVLNAGGTFAKLKSHNFKNMLDLLGGTSFEDYNPFGTDATQQQTDLNNPSKQVQVGDTYGYNYNLYATKIDLFTQFKLTYKKVDFYVGQSFSRAEYQREGLYKNGYYPTNSLGYSGKETFDAFGFKGGLTYKMTGVHYLNFNGVYMSKVPTLRNVFSNGRVNNNVTDGVTNETVTSADASYIMNAPKLKVRLTAFYSRIQNQTEASFFFGDGIIDDGNADSGSADNSFIAETVTGMNKRNMGLEFGMEYPITSTLKVTASAAYGDYIFDNNPNVRITSDANATATNTNPLLNYGEAHLKGYKQSGMPQAAGSFGLEYRDPHFWWIGANINYLANNYMDIAPITRTDRFFTDTNSLNGSDFPEATQERADELLKQEKFDNFELLNVTGGKSWKIKSSTLGFFASVSNVLDVKYKTGGFEQARNSNYRQLNQDVSSGTPSFGPKYFYGYGRTYFLNLYLNF